MSEIDAIGDAVTGGMIARAAEPRAGEPGHTHEMCCLNCGTPLSGPFCFECGQHAHVHRTLRAFFHDFAHVVLHFEGKIWRTLPLLAWKPGALTRRYIDGQRARFVSPIALFLFSIFLMFAALSASGNISPKLNKSSSDIAAQEKETQSSLAALEQQRAALAAKKLPTVDIDREIKDTKSQLVLFRTMRERGVTSAVLGTDDSEIDTDIPMLKDAFNKARQNPDLLIYKLKSNSYKWSWAIIPLSAPFVWLLFPFSRRFRFYDHVVFVTYSLSFMSILFAAAIGLSALQIASIAPLILLIPPIHMYRQLRGAYGIGRFAALWRTALLLLFAIVVLTTFIVLMAALGVLD